MTDCEQVSAGIQSSTNSLTALVNTKDSCGKKSVNPAIIGGAVAGGVVLVVVIIAVGVFALKKGYCRTAFRSEDKKEKYVI